MVFLLRMHLKQYGLTTRLSIIRDGGRGFQTYCFGDGGGGGGHLLYGLLCLCLHQHLLA